MQKYIFSKLFTGNRDEFFVLPGPGTPDSRGNFFAGVLATLDSTVVNLDRVFNSKVLSNVLSFVLVDYYSPIGMIEIVVDNVS